MTVRGRTDEINALIYGRTDTLIDGGIFVCSTCGHITIFQAASAFISSCLLVSLYAVSYDWRL